TSTSPPTRNARPWGASLAATCDGEKKKTRFDWNALSTNAAATPRATSPAAIQAKRRERGFIARPPSKAPEPPCIASAPRRSRPPAPAPSPGTSPTRRSRSLPSSENLRDSSLRRHRIRHPGGMLFAFQDDRSDSGERHRDRIEPGGECHQQHGR